MSRKNAKLINFLRQHLEWRSFINLKYELDQSGLESENMFGLNLPRYEPDKCVIYESVLKAWCETSGRQYKSYSNEKSTIKSALHKSDYLITLVPRGGTLRFRFATSDEIKDKKKKKKEKSNLQQPSPEENCNQPPSPEQNSNQPPSPEGNSNQPPILSSPSSVASSGYGSISDSEVERMETESNELYNLSEELDVILNSYVDDSSLDELIKYIEEDSSRENLPCENRPDGTLQLQSTPGSGEPLQNNHATDVTSLLNISLDDLVSQKNIQLEAFKPANMVAQFQKPVNGLKTSPVALSGTIKKYWVCTEKVILKGTLQMIFEMQIADQTSEIMDGLYVIPDGVLEPGVNYVLERKFELNNLCFLFFSINHA